jgi:hypothetical protein
MLHYDASASTKADGYFKCRRGWARLDAREFVGKGDNRLVFHRGGWGYVGGDFLSRARFAHLSMRDVVGNVTARKTRNGPPCRHLGKSYTVAVRSIPEEMGYLNASRGNSTTSYAIYGDQGELGPLALRGKTHFTSLSWSWINVQSGGVARASVRDGQRFTICRGVPAITLASVKSWSPPFPVNGWVRAVYGAVRGEDGERLYGWIVSAHQKSGQPVVKHLRAAH